MIKGSPEMPDDFPLLKRYVEQTLKIQCSSYKEDYIKRRFLSRMRSTNTTSYGEYLRYVRAHPAELEPLRNALTINVTEFFRDKEVFDCIRTTIIPTIFARRKRIWIWCAGCSTGEEPYSLAMILADMMAQNKELSGQITATDIDEVVLAKAKTGIFAENIVKKLRNTQIQRHFTLLPSGDYEVKQQVKDLIRFRPHDLMSGVPPVRFLDLITCRNVTIYFTENQKDLLARMFHSALSHEGFYVMGKTEYLGKQVDGLFTPFDTAHKIFIKSPQP
ncbi:chemotaxis protein methyltransferase cher [hydrocarbon metagenome]|uniref:protein-glutamate O-methyltransferase n=1 Tax=hydrocarbon metagenome TaxID=938273 RepID=A0A0W8F2T5_9ZZZZ